jgi:hypothetical protein
VNIAIKELKLTRLKTHYAYKILINILSFRSLTLTTLKLPIRMTLPSPTGQSSPYINMNSLAQTTLKRRSAPISASLLSQSPNKKSKQGRDTALTAAKPKRSRNIQDLIAFHAHVIKAEAGDLEAEAELLTADIPGPYLDSLIPIVERRLSRYSALLVLLTRLQDSPV